MTEKQKTLREKIAQLEFCQQNRGLLKKDCRQKNCTEVWREIFQDELTNPNSWPCGMADSILSLMLKEVEGARLTDEQIKLAAHNFTDTDYKYLKNVMETYPIQQFKGSAYNDAAQKLEWGKVASAQLEAVKKILRKV
jgi:hypothetical protein